MVPTFQKFETLGKLFRYAASPETAFTSIKSGESTPRNLEFRGSIIGFIIRSNLNLRGFQNLKGFPAPRQP
ncbi:hypothetical protein B0E43_22130 [Algoriphagus sp. A40]|nr:hypothetical protein B0E43_22130 [Algoriphagus sp. A40]